jgi:hypothetical protein
VRPPAQPLADRAVIERWHPDRGDEVAPGEIGEHARVDLVGLAGQRRDRLDLARVGDLDLPAAPVRRSRTQAAPLIISMQP